MSTEQCGQWSDDERSAGDRRQRRVRAPRSAVAFVIGVATVAAALLALAAADSPTATAQQGATTTLECPLTMTFVARDSGQLGPVSFPVSGFVITAVGQTIEEPSATSDFRRFIPVDSSVAVENVGAVDIGIPPMSVVNEDGYISVWTADGKPLVLGPFVGNWDMQSQFGTTGEGSLENWSSVDVRGVNGQRVIFDVQLGIEMEFSATPVCPQPTPTATTTATPTPTSTSLPITGALPTPTPTVTPVVIAATVPTPTPTVTPVVIAATVPTPTPIDAPIEALVTPPTPTATPRPAVDQPNSPEDDPPQNLPVLPTATPDFHPPVNPDPGIPAVEDVVELGDIIDPYECGPAGGSFVGLISGGTPPYRVGYELSRGNNRTVLPAFAVAKEGEYRSPGGYLTDVAPTGLYSVSVLVTDGLGENFRFSFGATIVATCPGDVAASASQAALEPTGGASAGTPPPAPPLAAPKPSDAGLPPAPELAFTGPSQARTRNLTVVGLLAIASGALVLAAPKLREPHD